jgi:hypothetical protein
MRAILAQTHDLDEALDKFGDKVSKDWTNEEKRKVCEALSLIQLHLSNDILHECLQEETAATLWLKLELISMSKDLTIKMHMLMKLFKLKMEEGGSVLNHIPIFKEILANLVSMEVKYEDEDLGRLLLCSLPSSFASFHHTIILSRDELTISDVYDALQSREKMKGMVHVDGSSSKGDDLQVRGKPEQRSSSEGNGRYKSQESRGHSLSRPPKKFCKYYKKNLLMSVGN